MDQSVHPQISFDNPPVYCVDGMQDSYFLHNNHTVFRSASFTGPVENNIYYTIWSVYKLGEESIDNDKRLGWISYYAGDDAFRYIINPTAEMKKAPSIYTTEMLLEIAEFVLNLNNKLDAEVV